MTKTAIEVEGLGVRFGEHVALSNVTLTIPENAFVAIVGPNGGGKSTLLKVLLGLLPPSTGTVRIWGRSPEEVPPEWIGYVPQVKTMDRSFPALSVELVMTGLIRRWPWRSARRVRQEAMAALERVGAAHLAQRPLAKLSGGELQRVCLARSMVRRPRLVMLDEPATGIDAIGEADMYYMLEAYQQDSGATLLMVTHDWHAATHHADLVLLLNRAQISFGPPRQALHEDNLRAAFGHIGHAHELKFLMESHE
ncbi:MAG: metal ABC transporter ATP-binding protein [candidate division KSB1 bacterium]|nr:metal ABC transporter ATP-binding protein [candidate division KSB1 bacterium]